MTELDTWTANSRSAADSLIARAGRCGGPPKERFEEVASDFMRLIASEELSLADAARVNRVCRAKLREEVEALSRAWESARRDRQRLEGFVPARAIRRDTPHPVVPPSPNQAMPHHMKEDHHA